MTHTLTVNVPNSTRDAIVECPPFGEFRNKGVYEIVGLKKDVLYGAHPEDEKLEVFKAEKAPKKPETETAKTSTPSNTPTSNDTETS